MFIFLVFLVLVCFDLLAWKTAVLLFLFVTMISSCIVDSLPRTLSEAEGNVSVTKIHVNIVNGVVVQEWQEVIIVGRSANTV
jgi:hypothetical protein